MLSEVEYYKQKAEWALQVAFTTKGELLELDADYNGDEDRIDAFVKDDLCERLGLNFYEFDAFMANGNPYTFYKKKEVI